ncbi:Ni-sirohydrochlorin a,c-diamide reductive cyclase catalytic subunit [Methanobrevibacter olleyae]|nr:Ni-sirohydrochlorin a,c-diamide reductive cyclase catalytic subunit [Methanobrevibacter olleyae]
MHPRPSPIAASLYTLRDLNADVIIMHGPHGCCFRTGRLLESDGVRVVTTAMAENDFILGAAEKLEETLKEAYDTFNPKLIGIVGTCASMIIGEDLKEPIENLALDAVVLPVESHGGFGEGDNTEGAIAVLNAAVEYGVISQEEADRQNEMLRLATQVEKTRGMAQGKYIKPNFGDSKEKVAKIIINAIKEAKKVVFVLNAKKETSYLFADILNCDFSKLFNDSNSSSNSNIKSNKDIENLHFIANLDENIGLPRIRQHAANINKELNEMGIDIESITGGLDEYPITPRKAEAYLKEINPDLVIVAGVPHALYVEELDCETIAVTDGPRLVEPLRELGYTHVIAELDAHSKTLGVDTIVDSDFGMMIRSAIEWEIG